MNSSFDRMLLINMNVESEVMNILGESLFP